MYKTIELETTKYWAETVNRDYKLYRRGKRIAAIERVTMFTLFAAAAGILGYMLANGYFENVDVIGTLERIGSSLGIGR